MLLQVPAPVNIELRQQLEDMGFSANKCASVVLLLMSEVPMVS